MRISIKLLLLQFHDLISGRSSTLDCSTLKKNFFSSLLLLPQCFSIDASVNLCHPVSTYSTPLCVDAIPISIGIPLFRDPCTHPCRISFCKCTCPSVDTKANTFYSPNKLGFAFYNNISQHRDLLQTAKKLSPSNRNEIKRANLQQKKETNNSGIHTAM